MRNGNKRGFGRIGAAVALAALGSGCGGPEHKDDGIRTSQQTGRFIDVQGLQVCSGKTCGATGPLGEFKYEMTINLNSKNQVDQQIPKATPTTFNITKDVALPSPPPSVPGYQHGYLNSSTYSFESTLHQTWYVSPYTVSTDPVVQRNVKLALLMIDGDGDPSNGIQIPTTVSTTTVGTTVNWSADDPRTDPTFAALQAAVKAADPSGQHAWPATDDVADAHFGPVWECALAGVMSGGIGSTRIGDTSNYSLTTAQLYAPTFTDTDGAVKTFSGNWNLVVMPSLTVGGVTWGSNTDYAPYDWGGLFYLTGGSQQPGPTNTINLTSTQYVDNGEFAPQANPQVPLSIQVQVGQANIGDSNATDYGPITGTWTSGTYTGGSVTAQDSARTDLCNNTNTQNDTTTDNSVHPDCQAFLAKYRFAYFPIWIQQRDFNNVNVTGATPYVLRVDMDGQGNTLTSFNTLNDSDPNTSTSGYPLMGKLDGNNGLALSKTSKDSPGYTWQLDTTVTQHPLGMTGSMDYKDGTHVLFDTTTRVISACATHGSAL